MSKEAEPWPVFKHLPEPARCKKCGKYAFSEDYHDDCEFNEASFN